MDSYYRAERGVHGRYVSAQKLTANLLIFNLCYLLGSKGFCLLIFHQCVCFTDSHPLQLEEKKRKGRPGSVSLNLKTN